MVKEMPMSAVQDEENAASDKLFPDLKEHLDYVNDAYNLAFKVQTALEGKRLAEVSDTAWAQFMILMRTTDFLRCIQVLAIKGYPEQAGTLAASVFELAHTAVFFAHSPETAKEWLQATSIREQAPRDIPGANWKEVVKSNCVRNGAPDNADAEYQVYQQLCWMKHSLPKMQDLRVEANDRFSLIFGPYTDERAINHSWFAMEHAGRLTEVVISLLMDEFGNDETKEALQALGEKRAALTKRAIDRFGQENPFKQSC